MTQPATLIGIYHVGSIKSLSFVNILLSHWDCIFTKRINRKLMNEFVSSYELRIEWWDQTWCYHSKYQSSCWLFCWVQLKYCMHQMLKCFFWWRLLWIWTANFNYTLPLVRVHFTAWNNQLEIFWISNDGNQINCKRIWKNF